MQIYIAHRQKTSNALNVYHYTADRNVFRCLQKVSLLTVKSLRQSGNKFHTNGAATEKSGRAMYSASDAVCSAVIDQQIGDDAVTQYQRLVGRSRARTAALDHVDS